MRGVITHIWMSPDTRKKSRYGLRTLGGIASACDAIEFIMAGATAIQVGTANFIRPGLSAEIAAGIQTWCDDHGVKDLDEIRGCV